MSRTLPLVVTTAVVALQLTGCYYYARPAGEPEPPGYGEPPNPQDAVPPGQAGVQPGQPPEAAGPPGTEQFQQFQNPGALPPAVDDGPPRRHRGIAYGPTAPHVTAPTIFGNGSNGAFRGLVYLVPDEMEHIPDFTALKPLATVFLDRFEVHPQKFAGGFPGVSAEDEWFAIKYEGNFLAEEGGSWRFRLVSDDGSALYIDGRKIIDNDGVHGVREVRGEAMLSPGRHHLRLDYFQGNRGPAALELYAAVPSNPRAEFALTGLPRQRGD